MATTSDKSKSIFAGIDWLTILIYIALLAMGWMSICGACYEYGQPRDLLSLADFGTRTGMQLVWIGSSMLLGAIILFLDDRFFHTFAYLIYGVLMLLLPPRPSWRTTSRAPCRGSRSALSAYSPPSSPSSPRPWHWRNS